MSWIALIFLGLMATLVLEYICKLQIRRSTYRMLVDARANERDRPQQNRNTARNPSRIRLWDTL